VQDAVVILLNFEGPAGFPAISRRHADFPVGHGRQPHLCLPADHEASGSPTGRCRPCHHTVRPRWAPPDQGGAGWEDAYRNRRCRAHAAHQFAPGPVWRCSGSAAHLPAAATAAVGSIVPALKHHFIQCLFKSHRLEPVLGPVLLPAELLLLRRSRPSRALPATHVWHAAAPRGAPVWRHAARRTVRTATRVQKVQSATRGH